MGNQKRESIMAIDDKARNGFVDEHVIYVNSNIAVYICMMNMNMNMYAQIWREREDLSHRRELDERLSDEEDWILPWC